MRNLLTTATATFLAAPQLFLTASAIELKGTCEGPELCIIKVEGDTILQGRARDQK